MLNSGLQWAAIVVLVLVSGILLYSNLRLTKHVRSLYTRIPRDDLARVADDADFRARQAQKYAYETGVRLTETNKSRSDEIKAVAIILEETRASLAKLRTELDTLQLEQAKIIEYEIKPDDMRQMVAQEVRANDDQFKEILKDEIRKYEDACRAKAKFEIKKAVPTGAVSIGTVHPQANPVLKLAPNSVEEIEEPAGELPQD